MTELTFTSAPALREAQPFRPLVVAALLGIVYVTLCGFFIFYSAQLAFQQADTLEHLRQLEVARGFLFVLVTGILFFFFTLFLFRRIVAQQAQALEQARALMEADRHAMTGLFAASMAHDMGNLLMVAQAGLFTLQAHPPVTRECGQAVGDLTAAHTQLAALVQRLLRVVRQRTPGHLEQVNLAQVARECLHVAQNHGAVRRCEVTTSIIDCEARANPVTLHRSLLNLIVNAADATDGNGRIDVRLAPAAGEAVLEVHDNGPGIPEELRQRIFEPFYTTKERGTGLGLLSVRACAEEHQGHVEVLSSPLGGGCFRLSLPLPTPSPHMSEAGVS